MFIWNLAYNMQDIKADILNFSFLYYNWEQTRGIEVDG
jgi:hypothetical protein